MICAKFWELRKHTRLSDENSPLHVSGINCFHNEVEIALETRYFEDTSNIEC